MAWTLADIRTKWRALTGLGSTDDISNANVDIIINDYYQQDFPHEADQPDKMLADYTTTITVDGSGAVALDDAELDLNPPITANEYDLVLYDDRVKFFRDYPINVNERFITAPTLAVGTDSTKVLCAAFSYKLSDWVYDKASAETALSGDTVPQNTYGAWMLSVDDEGTITITEADDNATGYATPGLAVRGIPAVGADEAIMGFVTAINSGGTFVPGTTALDAVTVTATYTDGDPGLRNIPAACCIADGNLFIRPKPNDKYLVRAKSSVAAPTTLSGSNTATDATWGPAIATGAAIRYLAEIGDTARVAEIYGDPGVPGTHLFHINRINRKRLRQDSDRACQRSF